MQVLSFQMSFSLLGLFTACPPRVGSYAIPLRITYSKVVAPSNTANAHVSAGTHTHISNCLSFSVLFIPLLQIRTATLVMNMVCVLLCTLQYRIATEMCLYCKQRHNCTALHCHP